MSAIYTVNIALCVSTKKSDGSISWELADLETHKHDRAVSSYVPFKFPRIDNFTLPNCYAYCYFNKTDGVWAPVDAWKIFACSYDEVPNFVAKQSRAFGHWKSANIIKYSYELKRHVVLMKKPSTTTTTHTQSKTIFVSNPNKASYRKPQHTSHTSATSSVSVPSMVKPHPQQSSSSSSRCRGDFRVVPQVPRVWKPKYPGEVRPPIPSDEILSQPTRLEFFDSKPKNRHERKQQPRKPRSFAPVHDLPSKSEGRLFKSPVPVPHIPTEDDESRLHKSPALVPYYHSADDNSRLFKSPPLIPHIHIADDVSRLRESPELVPTVFSTPRTPSPKLSKSPLSEISETFEPEPDDTTIAQVEEVKEEVTEKSEDPKFEAKWEDSVDQE